MYATAIVDNGKGVSLSHDVKPNEIIGVKLHEEGKAEAAEGAVHYEYPAAGRVEAAAHERPPDDERGSGTL